MFCINTATYLRRLLKLQRAEFHVDGWLKGNQNQNAVPTVNAGGSSTTATTDQVSQSPPAVAQKLSTTTQNASAIDMPSTTGALPSNPPGVSSTNESNNNNTNVISITGDVNRPHNNVIMSVGFNCHVAYFVLVMILLTIIALNFVSALAFSTLLLTFFEFFYFNKFMKGQVALRSKRNIGTLLIGIYLISMIIIDHYFCYSSIHLYFGLIFLPPYSQSISLTNMLWATMLGDYSLKFTTILFKMIVAIMPLRVLPIMKREKVYLFIEATSQLLRCFAPILAWSTYFLKESELYQFFGMLLLATYSVFKFFDVLYRLKLWWIASCNLFKNNNIKFKSVPCEEKITEVGHSCPICFEEFISPVMLRCKHIFCDTCITTWLECDQTCPICRQMMVNYPKWCDGSTTHFVQFL